MLGFVAVRLSVRYVGLRGCMAVSLICWVLWPFGCQSDMLGFMAVLAVSLICCALWLHVRQSDMLHFVAIRLSV